MSHCLHSLFLSLFSSLVTIVKCTWNCIVILLHSKHDRSKNQASKHQSGVADHKVSPDPHRLFPFHETDLLQQLGMEWLSRKLVFGLLLTFQSLTTGTSLLIVLLIVNYPFSLSVLSMRCYVCSWSAAYCQDFNCYNNPDVCTNNNFSPTIVRSIECPSGCESFVVTGE